MVSDREDRKRSPESHIMSSSPIKKMKSSDDPKELKSINSSYSAQLAIRIKTHLEEHKNKKFIDIEDMAQTLYDDFPEYRRKKYKVFKGNVEKTFSSLKSELVKLSSGKKSSKKESRSDSDVRTPDETTVKKTVNSRLSDMYAKQSPRAEPLNGTDAAKKNSDPEIVVMDDDDDDITEIDYVKEINLTSENHELVKTEDSSCSNAKQSNTEDVPAKNLNCNKGTENINVDSANAAPKDDIQDVVEEVPSVTTVSLKEPDDDSDKETGKNKKGTHVSDFERIQQKAQKIKGQMDSEKSVKVSRPSKLLASYLGSRSDESEPVGSPMNGDSSRELPNTNLSPEQEEADTEIDKVEKEYTKEGQSSDQTAPSVSKIPNKVKKKTFKEKTGGTPAQQVGEVENEVEESRNASSKRPSGSSDSAPKKRKTKNQVPVKESPNKFADFGGNDALLCEICKLLSHLKHPEIYRELGASPPRGFLLHGPPGCGKTLLAHAIAGELGVPFLKVAAPEIVSGVSGDSESKIRDLFQQAEDNAPSVLFFDEIDAITPKRENAQREMERRIVAQLLTCLDELGKGENQVIVIGATNRPESLDPALRRAGRFDREIALGIPDRAARHKILNVLCRNVRLDENVSLLNIASLTPGYVGADLSSLVRESAIASTNRMLASLQGQIQCDLEQVLEWLRETSPLSQEELSTLRIQDEDWKAALKVVQPSAKREGFATVPDVTWKDVGAMEAIREELQLSILAPVRFQEEFEKLGLPASSGVLLAGPPGCGKTLVAKAIANEAGINFISVKGPELLNMYVGESERAVRACFQRARNSAPCVIFFDEIDSLCPRRSGNSSDGGSSSRVVNQLLTEMDGVEIRNGVFLMAATNRPDILDPAVLRPGRLDKVLYVGFPSAQDRVDILKALTKNGTKPKLGDDVNLSLLGSDDRCQGFSGADMSALVREASMLALKDALKSRSQPLIAVHMSHFDGAFSTLKPSVDKKDRLKYASMEKRYGRGKEKSSPQEPCDTGAANLVSEEKSVIPPDECSMEIVSEPDEPPESAEASSAKNSDDIELDKAEPSVAGENAMSEEVGESQSELSNYENKGISESMELEEPSQTDVNQTETPSEGENLQNGKESDLDETSKDNNELMSKATHEALDKNNAATEEASCTLEEGKGDVSKVIEELRLLNEDECSANINPSVQQSLQQDTSALTTSDDNQEVDDNYTLEIDCTRDRDELLDTEKASNPNEDQTDCSVKTVQESGKPSSSLEKFDPSSLRYLPQMMIRVVDTSKVPSAAGKNGYIRKMRKNSKATVCFNGAGLSQRIIDIVELEPFMPEEGDLVKLLIAGDTEETGKVVSMDGDDICDVRISGNVRRIEIDHLCKITEEEEETNQI